MSRIKEGQTWKSTVDGKTRTVHRCFKNQLGGFTVAYTKGVEVVTRWITRHSMNTWILRHKAIDITTREKR